MKCVYRSENGYTGVIYGESSLKIYNENGNVCFHTGRRAIQTYNELVELVDGYPNFLEKLNGLLECEVKHD